MTFSSSVRLGSLALAATFAGSSATAQSFANSTSLLPDGPDHNASSSENVDFGDVDLDGDWDAVFADGGDDQNDQNRIWINDGGLQAGTIGLFTDETDTRMPSFLDDSRDIEFVDFDADGDLDLYSSNTSNISNQGNRWLTNQGGAQGGTLGFYNDETGARWVGLNSANSSINDALLLPNSTSPETFIDWSCDCDFGDLDNDGDMDLVHSSYGGAFGGQVPTRIFLNDGDGFFEEFNPAAFKLSGTDINPGDPGIWCEGQQSTNTTIVTGARCDIATSTLDIDLGDTDGDFDLDILHGDRETLPRFFANRTMENGGSLAFRDVTGAVYPAGYSTGDGHYEQEMGDLDGDGDLDLYGLNWLQSGFNFQDATYENNGSGIFSNTTALGGSNADDNEGDFFDYDNDGDLDLFVCNFSGTDKLYRNENNGGSGFSFTNVTGSELPSMGSRVGLDADAADVDNDGDYDLIVANDDFAKNRFLENITQVPDTTAPYLPAVEQAVGHAASNTVDVVRAQVYDNAPYYITWFNPTTVEISVEDPGHPIPAIGLSIPAVSVGGQIFRAELPGNLVGDVDYYFESSDLYGNSGTTATLSYTNTGNLGAQSGVTSNSSLGTAPAITLRTEPMGGQPLVLAGGGVNPGTLGVLMFSASTLSGLDLGGGLLLNVGPTLLGDLIIAPTDADGKLAVVVDELDTSLSGFTIYAQFLAADGQGGNIWSSSLAQEIAIQ